MTTSNVLPALERNRAFAAAGGHEGAVVFPNLSLFVVTCLDPRVDPAHVLGLGLSDAMVVRNVGGRVTREVIDDVAFISQIAESVIPDGPLFEVAVIHHTQCGAGALADDGFRRRYAERTSALATALAPVIGYERAAKLALEALEKNVSIRDLVRQQGILDEEKLDEILDLGRMSRRPGSKENPPR